MLSDVEFHELWRLMRLVNDGKAGWQEQSRLRHLLAQESPSILRADWPDVFDFGLFLLGLYGWKKGYVRPHEDRVPTTA